MMKHWSQLRSILTLSACLGAAPLAAQCQLTWSEQVSSGQLVTLINDSAVWYPNGPAAPKLVISGSFAAVSGGVPTILNGVRVLDLVSGVWSPLGTGLFYEVDAIDVAPNGNIVAGSVSGTPFALAGPVDIWDGNSWTGLPPANGVIYSVVWLPNGDILAGGSFSSVGGVAANNIARWDGSTWLPLGSGVNKAVRSMVVRPDGSVVVGTFGVAVGGVDANGIAIWDPVIGWTAIGQGLTLQSLEVGTVYLLPNGDILGGGNFALPGGNANTVARWDGTDWSEVGGGIDGIVLSFTELPNGELCAGGFFQSAGGAPANNIARLVGNSWQAIGPGLGSVGNHQVFTLTSTPDDALYAGGFFASTPGVNNASLSVLTSNCVATVTSYGNAGAGSGGIKSLAPDNAPYVGSVFQATGVGLGTPGLVLEVTGLAQTAIPLPSILPQGAPGSELLVQPIITNLLPGLGGAAQLQIPIPNVAALAGAQLFTQMVVLELGPAGGIQLVTASNGLQLTIGVF